MSDRTGRSAEPLSGADIAWLRMEEDTNHMTITVLLRFAEHLPLGILVDKLYADLLPFRRFRQRVVDRGHQARRPRWELHPHFDLEAHIHHVALPEPGDDRELAAMVGDLMASPLDPSIPLWSCHLIDLPDGRSDVVFRIHHSIADGFALLYLTLALADDPGSIALPVGRLPPPPEAREDASEHHSLIGDAIKVSSAALKAGAHALAHPDDLLGAFDLSGRAAQCAARVLALSPDAPTPLIGDLGVVKHVAWSRRLPLAPLKEVAHRSDGTLNDLLMSAMTGAVRRYLLGRGFDPSGIDVRSIVPVNMRSLEERAEPLGNDFGLVFLELPVGLEAPLERFAELRRRMAVCKGTPEAAVVFGLIAAAGSAPPALQRRLLRLFWHKASLIVTNVPGPTSRIRFAGREVEDVQFWVPQSQGIGVGLSIFSYDGHVRIGAATDARLVPDPDELVRHFEDEVELLSR